jgi:hypothetical protein
MLLLERLRWRRRGIEASDAGIEPEREHEATVRLERASSSEISFGITPPWSGTPVRLMATTRREAVASQVMPEKLQWRGHGGDAGAVDEDVMSQSASEVLLRALPESKEDLSLERAYRSAS